MKPIKTEKGFILVEVLVSCLILSIFIISLSGIFFSHGKSIAETRAGDIALNLAGAALEMEKKDLNASFCDKYPDYRCEVDVKDLNEGVQEINITVFYNSGGEERQLSLSGLKSK